MRRRRLRTRDDRGSWSVEAVILLPVVILLSMAALQVAMVVHAHDVARTVARQALNSARVVDGTAEQGEAAATRFLALGDDGLKDPRIEVNRGAERVTATVSAEVLSLVPGWRPTVTANVSAPTERVVE